MRGPRDMSNTLIMILEEIRKMRVFTPDLIARKLDVPRETVEKVIGLLLAQGKIRRVKLECPCDRCIFSKICTFKREGNIVFYEIVEH